jgi:hypothetical protein
MRVGGIAKVIGHVFLSVVLMLLIFAAVFGTFFFFAGDSLSGPEPSPPLIAAGSFAGFLTLGVLIAQWHRRVSIRRRLLSVVFGCAIITSFALLGLLLPAAYVSMVLTTAATTAVIASLITLGTIEFPWPIPFATIWRGELGLARTYWVWNTLVIATVMYILTIILQLFYAFTGSFFIIALKLALSLLLSTFMVVSIWRSAGNYKGPRRWRALARATCIIFGIVAVINLGGLLGEVPLFKAVAAGDQASLDAMIKSLLGKEAQ